MRAIRPITITAAMITACNVPETDYAAWSSATTYIIGNRCIFDHKIYEASAGSTNQQPDTNSASWFKISATNRWKAFDKKILDQVSNLSSISYTFTPGVIFDSLAILNMQAAAIEITVTDALDGEVYHVAESLTITDQVYDLYTFFFEPTETLNNLVKLDIPIYKSTIITITLTGSGDVKLGEIVLGTQIDLGITKYSPIVGIKDYSTRTTDTFGDFEIVERGYASKLSCSMRMSPVRFDYIKRRLAHYRATPLVWVGSYDPTTGINRFSSMVIYGPYESFSMVIPGPNESGYNLELISFI